MKRIVFLVTVLFAVATSYAQPKEYIWPKSKMPSVQEHQIAAKLTDVKKDGFRPEDNRIPYLEWYQAPEKPNGGCMILLSGGSYKNWCDVSLVEKWANRFTELGFQCVALD